MLRKRCRESLPESGVCQWMEMLNFYFQPWIQIVVIILIKVIFNREIAFTFFRRGNVDAFSHQKRLHVSLSFLCQFSGLYILSFVIIMVGFILYCSTPTRTAESTTLPQLSSTGLDNAALKLEENDSQTPGITVQFSRGDTVVVSSD